MRRGNGPAPQKPERRWYETAGLWIGLGLLVLFAIVLAIEWRDEAKRASRPVESPAEPEPERISLEGPVDAARAEVRAVASADEAAPVEKRAESPRSEPSSQVVCRRAPVRGCAPSKDQQGCYHCTRCWRPFHYDADSPVNTLSFTCPDMPEAPVYVELSAVSSASTSQRWEVSVSFDGRHLEQEVAPNLGGAFFAGFRGGTVDLKATMKTCDTSSGACKGDIDVAVNARPDSVR
jgi:hypothetical protein